MSVSRMPLRRPCRENESARLTEKGYFRWPGILPFITNLQLCFFQLPLSLMTLRPPWIHDGSSASGAGHAELWAGLVERLCAADPEIM